MRKAILALAASAFAIGGAHAQEVIVDDAYMYDDPIIEDRAYLDEPELQDEVVIERVEPADAPRADSETRVYGWQLDAPPTSCGVFKYWDGQRCADARTAPPDLD